MIAHIEGKVLHLDIGFIIVSTGGIGYKIATTPETVSGLKVGQTTSLWIHHAIREDAQDLYGFPNREALGFFQLLITISGIGPKTAMGILNLASLRTLKTAIVSGEPTQLTKIAGIGKKNAEKIVLELRDKIEMTKDQMEQLGIDDTDTVEALKSLGYQDKEIRETLKKISHAVTDPGKRVTAALKLLGK